MSKFSDFVVGLLRRAGERIFRADDQFARHQGWGVEKGRFGLSRTYRHPGFDRLAACPLCSGRGQLEDTDCSRCAGTGRISLSDPVRAKKVTT